MSITKLDDSNFDFSQRAIKNINILIKRLKTKLDINIFPIDQLVGFLVLSLSDFNQTPSFTYFTFEDTRTIEFFSEILISGASLYALSSQALIEKGKECQITDNGLDFDPPKVSEMLNTQYSTLLVSHFEKLKFIKSYITSFDTK